MRRIGFLVVCAGLSLVAPATASARTFSVDDYDRIVSVSDAQISPDGKRIVISVGHIDVKKDRTLSELVLVNVATGEHRVLTHGREDVGDARWSPNGDSLAFIAPSGSGDDATPQVYVMPMNGGDARVVTKAENGVAAYTWSPDGKAVAYLMEESAPKHAAGVDLFNVGDDAFSTQHPAQPTHLFTQQISGGSARQLTEGPQSIWPDAISWSADGRYIAFERTPDGRFDGVFQSKIAVVDVATRQVTVVDNRWGLLPVFGPSGHELAYTAGEHGSFILQNGLAVDTVGEAPRDAAPGLNRNVQFVAWLPDGGLIVGADDHVVNALWRVSASGTTNRVDLGDLSFGGASVARDGGIALVASSSTRPSELYYLAPGSDSPRRLTNYNGDIAALDLSASREFTWHNDGMEEDGVLTYPVGYGQGRKYPLVLDIHGGPVDEASTTAFNALVQLLAAHGFIVLEPNYRGSDNLGYAYIHAIIGLNPIAGAGSDDVAGIKALEATGAVDNSRIGVSGWSAGGWSTSWLITQYPDLFKAAVSGAAVNDQVMQYTLSQGPAFIPELYGGLTPWEPGGMEAYRNSSPITFVQNVHAATLILSDTTDPRVPTPEAYEFYKALRDLGRTVEFTAIPAYGHHPSDPVHNREIDRIWVDWMVKYLSP